MHNVKMKGLCFIILGSPGTFQGKNQLYQYNPRSSEWTHVREQRSQAAICTLNGRIYVIGIIPVLYTSDALDEISDFSYVITQCQRFYCTFEHTFKLINKTI